MFVHGVADNRVGCFIGSQCSESGVCVYREGTKVSHYIINSVLLAHSVVLSLIHI